MALQANNTSPRAAAELARHYLVFVASRPGLLLAAVQGGLVQLPAELCLAWLQSDGFQVRTSGSALLLLGCSAAALQLLSLLQQALSSRNLTASEHQEHRALQCKGLKLTL